MCIGSVYGPNIDENILVYEQLQKGVLEMGCETIILGGDWNCTWDCCPVDTNINVLDMAAIPSKLRSEKFKKMCKKLKIPDPYRFSIRTNLNTLTYRPRYTTSTVLDSTSSAYRRRLLTTFRTAQLTMPSLVPFSTTKVFCLILGKKSTIEKTCK